MALEQADIEFIKHHIGEWLTEQTLGKPPAVYEIELRERMIRVEEELKNQRDLILQIVHQMDMRFAQVDKHFEQLDKRFDLIEKRIDGQREDMNRHFELIEKRFEQVDKRFEQVDKRFEDLRSDMNHRFDQMDRRFEALTRRMDRFMIWSFGVTLAVGGTVVAAMRFLL
jgi:chaperonin cofactor prefoldin